MTEPKHYYATQVVSRMSIAQSNDMALVHTEKHLLVMLYMEADMPRDFRIQFRYEPLELQDSIKCVGRLTVIDPTNPRIEEDKDWFKWLKHAQVRDNNVTVNAAAVRTTVSTTSSMSLLEQLYEPVIKAQLDQVKDLRERLETIEDRENQNKYTIGIEIQRDRDGYDDD